MPHCSFHKPCSAIDICSNYLIGHNDLWQNLQNLGYKTARDADHTIQVADDIVVRTHDRVDHAIAELHSDIDLDVSYQQKTMSF